MTAKISINNGLTYITAAEVPESILNDCWDVIVMMMDDETREKAHQIDQDIQGTLHGLFLPVETGYYEDKRRFLKIYLDLASDNLAI